MTSAQDILVRLDDEWNIKTPEHHLEGANLGTAGESKVVFAIDPQGCRHLLVATRSRSGFPPHRWKGLTASVNEWTIAEHGPSLWIDIKCAGIGYERVFRALCSDIIKELPQANVPAASAVASVLSQWVDFWRLNAAFPREAEIGLIGELVFLRDWLIPHHGNLSISFWTGPTGTVHDFTSSNISVEVKTTSTTQTTPVHTISSLEQLDNPASGSLYLASFQVMEDPIGDLNISTLVQDIVANLSPGSIWQFERRLAHLELPDQANLPTTRWRQVSGRLYAVRNGFPRLTWTTLPGIDRTAIPNASYRLEMAACGDWLEEDHPTGQSVLRLMHD